MFRSLIPIVGLLSLISCSSTPKGEYSRSVIDRPYALPDDVATTTFSSTSINSKLKDSADSVSGESEELNQSLPSITFENGIGTDVSWIYPIGVKWGIYNNEKHTFGFSFATVFLLTTYSLDYWYRISDSLSLRPYYRGYNLDFIIVEEERRFTGADLIFQATSNFAITGGFNTGTYKGKSELFDLIVNGDTTGDDLDVETEGTFTTLSLGLTYSLSDYWDLFASFAREDLKVEDFETETTSGTLGARLIW